MIGESRVPVLQAYDAQNPAVVKVPVVIDNGIFDKCTKL